MMGHWATVWLAAMLVLVLVLMLVLVLVVAGNNLLTGDGTPTSFCSAVAGLFEDRPVEGVLSRSGKRELDVLTSKLHTNIEFLS